MENARLGRRLAAIAYDSLLLFGILVMVTAVFFAIRMGEPPEPEDPLHQFALVAAAYAFFVGFWSRKGRTLGMQSWGLQLQDQEDKVPSVSACTIRFAVAIVSWAVIGLGFLWQLWDRDRLTWHDRLSGTRLVYYPRD